MELQANGKKQDLRVIRTKKNIREAFYKLLSEKAFESITVSELAQKADINRKTFYLHYSSTKDLLDEIQQEIIERMLQVLGKYDILSRTFDPYPMFLEFNESLTSYVTICKSFLFSSSLSDPIRQVKNAVLNSILAKYSGLSRQDRIRAEYYIEYASTGLIALYLKWLSHDPPQISTEALAEITSEISYHGFDDILAKYKGFNN